MGEEGYPELTSVEQKMIAISASVRNKPKWYEKYLDQEIIQKWRIEANKQLISNQPFEYVIKELGYYHSLRSNGIEMSTVEGVWQTDELIDQKMNGELTKEVFDVLENVEEVKRDWHPNSNDQVLDLLHPSLFCCVNGRSLSSSPLPFVFLTPNYK